MSLPVTAPPNCVPVQVAIAGDQGYAIAGQIWSGSERFPRMLLSDQVETGELIEMSIDGCSFAGEVTFCQPCPEGYNVGVQLVERDSIRREPRFPLDLTAALTVIGSSGPREAAVRLTNVSASGVGLFGAGPIQIGACVEINLDLGLLFGEIRHCHQNRDGRFRIGVAIYHMIARQNGESARPMSRKSSWLRRNSGPHKRWS